MSWFSNLSDLPELETAMHSPLERRKFESRQHPDIDTTNWP
jgi:hypothetical protein